VTGYLDTFLIGFSNISSLQEGILARLNPLFFTVGAPPGVETGLVEIIMMYVVYFVIACGAIAAAFLLYKRRRLERAGSPISFRFAEIIITDLITLVCMAAMGIAFFQQSFIYGYGNDGKSDYGLAILSLIAGCVLGAALAFMVVTMLAQKTPRIFTKKTFKDFGIFAVIGVLFISFTVFDLTGYTERVPGQASVKKAEMTLSQYPFMYPYEGLRSYYLLNDMKVEAVTKEDVKALIAFHRGLIENEKAYRYRYSRPFAGLGAYDDNYKYDESDSWSGSAAIVYDQGGPFSMYRSYDFHYNYSNAELRETLAAMPAFRESMTLEKLAGYENISAITVIEYEEMNLKYKISSSDIAALAMHLDNDFRRLDAGVLMGRSANVINAPLKLQIEIRHSRGWDSGGFYTDTIGYTVTSSYTETLKWLGRKPDI
jgi:hypothetical protein